MGRSGLGVQPVAQCEESLERTVWRLGQNQWQRPSEAARVADQIPKPREASDSLHVGERELIVGENGVGRHRAVAHRKALRVATDRRTAQPLQDADLNLVRTQPHQRVEPFTKTRERFARQPSDQIDVQVRMGMRVQPAQIVLGALVVLLARDVRLHLRVPRLDADLELQCPGRKARNARLQFVGQMIGNQLEVREAWVVGPRLDALQKEFEDGERRAHVEVERAIDEFEGACAALVQGGQFGEESFQREGQRRAIERRQAELALERAAARGLDEEVATRDILVRVVGIGKFEFREVGHLTGEDLRLWRDALKQHPGKAVEGEVALPRHHMVG